MSGSERDDQPRQYASPACARHELEGEGASAMDAAAVVATLNALLEGERAGARGLRELEAGLDGELRDVLVAVGQDEARFCGMLIRHIERLGGEPTRAIGAFYGKLMERPDLPARLQLLDRGQKAVVRMLDELLGQSLDRHLRADLEEMRRTHVENVERCAVFLPQTP